jgi:hypothetical protein
MWKMKSMNIDQQYEKSQNRIADDHSKKEKLSDAGKTPKKRKSANSSDVEDFPALADQRNRMKDKGMKERGV